MTTTFNYTTKTTKLQVIMEDEKVEIIISNETGLKCMSMSKESAKSMADAIFTKYGSLLDRWRRNLRE